MKEYDIEQVLRRGAGEADAPSHRTALRRALLSAHPGAGYRSPLRTLVTFIVMKKHYIPAGALTALLIVGIFAFSISSSSVAQAQELVNRSMARAVEISPEVRAQLEAQMKADMLKTLAEAKAAPDLRILTKEQFEKESQFSFSTGPAPMLGASSAPTTFKSVSMTHVGVAPAGEQGATFSVNTQAVPVGAIAGSITVSMVSTSTQASGFTVAPLNSKDMQDVKFTAGTVVNAGMASFSEPVTYLMYTDPQGRKTALGLDKNDTPVFKISTLNENDVHMMKDGSISIDSNTLTVLPTASATEVK